MGVTEKEHLIAWPWMPAFYFDPPPRQLDALFKHGAGDLSRILHGIGRDSDRSDSNRWPLDLGAKFAADSDMPSAGHEGFFESMVVRNPFSSSPGSIHSIDL